MNKPNIIFQFKITLEGIIPSIWRRIQVPLKYSLKNWIWQSKEKMGEGFFWSLVNEIVLRLERNSDPVVSPDQQQLGTFWKVLPRKTLGCI